MLRWVFLYSATGETYTPPLNPNAMTSLFPSRKITTQTATGVGGQVLMFEGNTPPQDWTFQGNILDEAHFEALRHWTYDIKQRIQITDHFGRPIVCVLTDFDAVPKRSVGVYWRHTYSVKAIVVSVGAPTVLS